MDLFQTALRSNEILVEIRVPTSSKSVAYVKSAQKASGFAIAGVAVVITTSAGSVQVGVTGVTAKPYRATAVERELQGQPLTPEKLASAARKAAGGRQALNDLHASAEYRVQLAKVNTKRALELAASRSS